MQSILEQTVKTLHEANGSRGEDEQYTILDGLRILADDDFKAEVTAKVNDPFLLQWWARDFAGWRRDTKADALAPVQTRLSYYSSSKRARAILGQPRSTIDMRRVIYDGGILLVSTAQGEAGRDVAALVGASLLNLVDAVIREQGSLPPEQRRGALVVVDEMQSMPGVDYESMLSELGKFGASFVLATQSLAKLDDLSRTMRDTILANVGCLAVFQIAGADARQMVWELGKERVSEDDITSLPVHQCYVRPKAGGSVPDPDRSPGIESCSPSGGLNQGQAPARCVMRHSGVEPCSSGVHVDAVHHTMLANTVGAANIDPGGENRKSHGNPGTESFGLTCSQSAPDTALTPHPAAGTGFPAPGRFLTPAV